MTRLSGGDPITIPPPSNKQASDGFPRAGITDLMKMVTASLRGLSPAAFRKTHCMLPCVELKFNLNLNLYAYKYSDVCL